MSQQLGRRDRKKAQTRQALADVALDLFLERGYDQVGVREIADAVDISTTTLFKYFPSKEALVFDLDEETEGSLVAAVRDRPDDQTLIQALRGHVLARVRALLDEPRTPRFWSMVATTPALHDYCRRMSLRHEDALTAAIAADLDVAETDPACRALAHFALETIALVLHQPDPMRAAETVLDMLADGWAAGPSGHAASSPG